MGSLVDSGSSGQIVTISIDQKVGGYNHNYLISRVVDGIKLLLRRLALASAHALDLSLEPRAFFLLLVLPEFDRLPGQLRAHHLSLSFRTQADLDIGGFAREVWHLDSVDELNLLHLQVLMH